MDTPTSPTTPTVLKSVWREIYQDIYNELDDEQSLQKILFYYDCLEEMETDENQNMQTRFYNAIDRDDDKLNAAIKLMNVLKSLSFHSGLGENMADKVQKFIDRLKSYMNQFAIEEREEFVGREREHKLIKELLEVKDDIVVLCGIGGQGKTSLAKKVCQSLLNDHVPWFIAKADLRDRSSTKDVIQSLLASLAAECHPSATQEELENILKQRIMVLKTNVVLWLDDCDLVVKSDRYSFDRFIQRMSLEQNETPSSPLFQYASVKVRFLLTMREKIPGTEHVKKKLTKDRQRQRTEDMYVKKIVITNRQTAEKYAIAEVELGELDRFDAIELLKQCSKPVDVVEKIADEIVKECASSPLAITVVAKLVKEGKYTPEEMLFHLKMDTKNVSKELKVDHCLQQAIDSLSRTQQQVLVALSIFQSSPFNAQAARKVMKTIGDDECTLTDHLKALYDRHLVEVEGDVQIIVKTGDLDAKSEEQKKKARNTFSLHPLVYRYVSERKLKEFKDFYKNAINAFVAHYELVISEIVRLLESKFWKGYRKLQFENVHIMRFYDTLDAHSELLGKHDKRTTANGVYRRKRVSDLADILLPIVKNRRIFQNEADRAKKAGNDGVYVFWMVEKADVFLMLHDQVECAIKILDELSDGKYPSLRGFHDEPFYQPLVHALFHKVKGLCRWKQNENQLALKHLDLSLRFYGRCEPKEQYRSFIARVKCYMGQVYLSCNDLDSADILLKEGHELVKGMVETKNQDVDEMAKELHWDIPRYYNHFALIKLKKAKVEQDTERRNHLLDTALEDLEKGICLDNRLKMNHLDGHYGKLKLRADVKIEKGLLNEALCDAEFALDRRRAILQPPHTHYTESVYQVARIYMLKGDDCKNTGDDANALKHWRCSADYFDELKDCHLKEGGISLTNPVLHDIQNDNLKVIKSMNDPRGLNDSTKFYQKLNAGKFESQRAASQKSIVQMLYTPFEMVKKYFGGGGAEFGDPEQKLTKLENLARVQEERMARGEPCGGDMHDSDKGYSSSDLGESFSSGSGSMSSQFRQMHLEKSMSLENDVFQEKSTENISDVSGEIMQPKGTRKSSGPPIKKQKSSTDNNM